MSETIPKRGPGRPPGSPNKVNAEFRETVRRLLEDNAQNVGRWLHLVAEGDGTDSGKPDPGKALTLLAQLAEYASPKLARTESHHSVTEETHEQWLARLK